MESRKKEDDEGSRASSELIRCHRKRDVRAHKPFRTSLQSVIIVTTPEAILLLHFLV
jgi:hypothetical protein